MKRFCLSILSSLFILATPSFAFAAVPDGAGPWADSVVSSSQGLRKDGGAVPALRSDPTSALGVAEDDTVDGHFFSLGFGGVITLGFDNGISSGTMVVEATNTGYPVEHAKVEVSPDGSTWILAGTVDQDGTVALPQSVSCAKYVRITDTSNKDDFADDAADGYDVDGVKALGDPCTPPTPTPTPPCDNHNNGCCAGNVNVSQTNVTKVVTLVSQSGNTGKNTATGNTGGNTKIKTGNVKNKTTIQVQGGSNTANVANTCCTGGSVAVNNNGAFSRNSVSIH